jgi:hypothetical protein
VKIPIRLRFGSHRIAPLAGENFMLLQFDFATGLTSGYLVRRLIPKTVGLVDFARWVMVIAMLSILPLAIQAQTAQSVQYTQNTPDQTLRSDMKVDPSTLGLSIQVPIAGYPGRAGAGLPIMLYYSSKQWRLQYDLSWTDIHNVTYSETHPVYAEHSKSGWSSSLGVPYIEWTNYSQPYVGEGEAYCSGCPDQTITSLEYFNRIHLHMPDGSTHELRLNDDEATSPSFTGVFVASDGSHIKYDADNQMVYLADGALLSGRQLSRFLLH